MNLLSFIQGKDIKSDPELLQTVLEVIDFGEMPQEENQPIDNAERKVIVSELKKLRGIGFRSERGVGERSDS